MGLVVANSVGLSGLVASKPDVQIITSSTDNVVIPAGSTRVFIQCIGAGGGGAAGRGGAGAGGGGGGGALSQAIFDAGALEPTLDVVVGGGGAAGNNANEGGHSEVHLSSAGTVILKAYGGGGGDMGDAGPTDGGSGGGGGGTGTIGINASVGDEASNDGGDPDIQAVSYTHLTLPTILRV